MADISKIKLNNNGTIATYNIKDEKSRTGFATASWVTYTENLLEKHKMAWYEDNAKTTELGSVSLDDRTLSNLTVLSSLNIPDKITFTGNGVTGTSTKLFVRVNSTSNKPEYVLLSTTTGTSNGNATEVTIPMGANGTVALLSDIAAASSDINDLIDQLDDTLATKVGWGFKTNNNTESSGLSGHTILHFREGSSSNTDLFPIPLDNVQFESIIGCSTATIADLSTSELSVNSGIIELGNEYTRLVSTVTTGGSPRRVFLFESGTASNNLKTVTLDMNRNGTIALQEELFGGVYYNNSSTPPQIEFYSIGDWDSTNNTPVANSTPIATLDASAFVKDAMVSKVEISNDNLVITWNSDAALLPTSIPLTNIFDPDDYYKIPESDARYVTSVNWNSTGTEGKITLTKNGIVTDVVEVLSTVTSGNKKPVSSGAVYTALEGKANKSEMIITPGTGDNADKTTIQLKNDTSATVLTAHQDISGKEDKAVGLIDWLYSSPLGIDVIFEEDNFPRTEETARHLTQDEADAVDAMSTEVNWVLSRLQPAAKMLCQFYDHLFTWSGVFPNLIMNANGTLYVATYMLKHDDDFKYWFTSTIEPIATSESASQFVVTVIASTSGNTTTYSADKTFAQIKAAHLAKRDVIVVYKSSSETAYGQVMHLVLLDIDAKEYVRFESAVHFAGTNALISLACDEDDNWSGSFVSIPDELADLTEDSTHRLVTDAEKSTWNKKVIYGKLVNGSFYKGDRGNDGTWIYSVTAETAAVDLIYVDVNANPPKAYCWNGSYKELSITVASEITENGTNPVQSSTIYTALQGLTNAFNTAIDDVIEDVTYTSATRLLSKKKVGDSNATGLVILPTATVTSETLEIVLASVPS